MSHLRTSKEQLKDEFEAIFRPDPDLKAKKKIKENREKRQEEKKNDAGLE